MNATLATEIEELQKLNLRDLRARYEELFGDESRTWNRQFLFRRIAWRLQAMAYGDLSQRARERAVWLARDADLKRQPPKHFDGLTQAASGRDRRLPGLGTVLKRKYGGVLHKVTVRANDFQYEGQSYRSLSAVAKAITGTRWNGYTFFGLKEKRRG